MNPQPALELPQQARTIKCTCADLWSHPIAQLLAGPALRPGGRELTRTVLARTGLEPGARVLDVGSGTGATLAELGAHGFAGYGVDYSRVLAAQAVEVRPAVVGDAEALPYRDGAFGAVLAECVLSAVPDKDAALEEARRVLATDGSVILADMVVEAKLPEPLQSVAAWAACVGGALSGDGYEALLRAHGFVPSYRDDASGALSALVDQAERRLAMLRGAIGVGLLEHAEALVGPDLERLGVPTSADGLAALSEVLFAQVRAAVAQRQLGYVAFVAGAASTSG